MRDKPTNSCIDCSKKIDQRRKRCSPCHFKQRIRPESERFWKKVKKTESCWLWIGSKKSKGWGQIRTDGKARQAHRVSWEIHRGPIPDGLEVMHNCPIKDNPSCVNPQHLRIGTHKENLVDASQKGQMQRGEDRWNARITETIVKKMRDCYIPYQFGKLKIMEKFKLPRTVVEGVIYGTRWKWVK